MLHIGMRYLIMQLSKDVDTFFNDDMLSRQENAILHTDPGRLLINHVYIW